ncbi:MAG TPA: HlyD family efflux transporter periplasmic adaptor subunit [Gemmatimonadaceae bacterium]|nr:HlyD family efflux transporter periplasmic adaptor subunit [Gemmatimonadaceae bacterium]
MDVARPPKKKTARNVGIGIGVLALVLITLALSRLQPASPTVDGGTLLMDSVRKGDVVREVRGPGNLLPERIRWITAQASARVERLIAVNGAVVGADEILLELSNPDQQIATMQADQALSQARADLVSLRSTLTNNRLSQEGAVATTNTQFVSVTQEAAAADSLLRLKLISTFEYNNKKAVAEELTTRVRVEKERLALMRQAADSQIAVATANLDRLKQIADFQHAKLNSLHVRAPEAGVLQDLTLQMGQWVPEGTTLAKVVQPGKLKAVLRIPESQAKDVQIGQLASIDTRNGLIPGHVSRKDPSAQTGTLTIDVALDGPLPSGAVPDLSIDGTIQIEQLKNVLYTGRPASGAGTGTVGIFRLVDGGKAAVRTQVVLGRSSVTTVEIVRGLQPGDRVILSDMSQYDNVERVRIK